MGRDSRTESLNIYVLQIPTLLPPLLLPQMSFCIRRCAYRSNKSMTSQHRPDVKSDDQRASKPQLLLQII
jgi:hypothetical protein